MKIVVLITFFLFALSSVGPLFADEGASKASKKSIFQELNDGLSEFGKFDSSEKKPFSAIFQRSSDYIEETSPIAKKQSLRENEEELNARRGMPY